MEHLIVHWINDLEKQSNDLIKEKSLEIKNILSAKVEAHSKLKERIKMDSYLIRNEELRRHESIIDDRVAKCNYVLETTRTELQTTVAKHHERFEKLRFAIADVDIVLGDAEGTQKLDSLRDHVTKITKIYTDKITNSSLKFLKEFEALSSALKLDNAKLLTDMKPFFARWGLYE